MFESMIWEPLRWIGSIELGAPLGDATSRYGLVHLPDQENDGTGWLTYGDCEGALRVHVEDNVVISVACYESCVFTGQNLIGMPVKEALALLGCSLRPADDYVYVDDGRPQGVYEVESLEAQLWEKDGSIVTVCCSPLLDEE